jgi:hypothetical protein
MITDVLTIEFTLGTVTWTLGGIAIASILLGAGVNFFRKLGGRR